MTMKKKDVSKQVPQRDKINHPLNIRHREDFTENQKKFIELATSKESKIIFFSGPSGCSKTFMSVYCSLLLMNSKRISDIIYVRSPVESSDSKLGFLPGNDADKMAPYIQPLLDKLDELLSKSEVDFLVKEKRVTGLPIGFARGLNWNSKSIILEEAQNSSFKEIVTILTRIGQFSKMFILGDPFQSDINGKSGFVKAVDLFDDEVSRQNGIYVVRFTKDDIVRSGILKFILEKIEHMEVKK